MMILAQLYQGCPAVSQGNRNAIPSANDGLRYRRVMPALVWAICFLSGSVVAHAGLVFNLTDTGGAGMGTQARTGFEAAAAFWSSQFTDNIEVNLNIGFAALSPGVLGQAGSSLLTTAYTNYRNAALADVTSSNDGTFTGALTTNNQFSVYINRTTDNPNGSGSTTPYVDNDGGNNNTSVRMTTANAKALGLFGANNPITDASITFNSLSSWDFDPSDGISGGNFDFIGVAVHEIGHALGFISGVDSLDTTSPLQNDDFFDDVSPLDFTRFSTDSESAGAGLDFTADRRSKYFSINGGLTAAAAGTDHWSTGRINGDGRQASHWKDNLGLGVMDPTFSSGELGVVTALDILAFDVIGYDLAAVPEASQLLCGLLVVIGAICRQTLLWLRRSG